MSKLLSFQPVADAIALEASRITYGNSYVQAMKRAGFPQAIYPQPKAYLALGCPLSYAEVEVEIAARLAAHYQRLAEVSQ